MTRPPSGKKNRSLSEKQQKIAALLMEGYGATDIGKRLFVSTKTVSTQILRMRDKLVARSTLHLAVLLIMQKYELIDTRGHV